jgi:Lrp/AsnC family leucine-responsive transcriptional regulator
MIEPNELSTEVLDATDLKLLALLQADASLNNVALAEKLHISAPTCLRRTKRLQQEGWIEKQVAILSADKLGRLMGHGLTALIEVSLDKQGEEWLQAFETRAVKEQAVQQCWRVSPGPDFMLVVQTTDMPAYLALTQRLLTQDANVRNVKAFFSVKRAKFGTELALPSA